MKLQISEIYQAKLLFNQTPKTLIMNGITINNIFVPIEIIKHISKLMSPID
jgi:hypothetical protein